MKREANFQTVFNHWLKSEWKETGCFELKQTKTNSIAFSTVKNHQVDALLNAKRGTLAYKIPDCGYQNPFDCVCLSGVPAFVVVKFPEFFCLIDIDDFIRERDNSRRKSLTSEAAPLLSTVVVACGTQG